MDDERRCDAQHSTCCLAQNENYIMILLRQRSILELLVSRWVGGGGEEGLLGFESLSSITSFSYGGELGRLYLHCYPSICRTTIMKYN